MKVSCIFWEYYLTVLLKNDLFASRINTYLADFNFNSLKSVTNFIGENPMDRYQGGNSKWPLKYDSQNNIDWNIVCNFIWLIKINHNNYNTISILNLTYNNVISQYMKLGILSWR